LFKSHISVFIYVREDILLLQLISVNILIIYSRKQNIYWYT